MKKWSRYRFKTKAEDYRPLLFNPAYPYWVSGEDSEDNTILIAYLPEEEPLYKYWDDAFDIDLQYKKSIEFTDRFPRPNWYDPS